MDLYSENQPFLYLYTIIILAITRTTTQRKLTNVESAF